MRLAGLRKIAKTFRHGHRSYDYERLVLALLPAVNKKLAA
jgi:hypothetical protein